MLTELETQIIEAIESVNIKAFPFSDKPEQLFSTPKLTPSARVVIEKLNFTPISSHAFIVVADFSVFVFFRSLQGKVQNAYTLVENTLRALVNKTQFNLEPQEIELFYNESGEFAWRISCKAELRYVVPTEEEPLTRRITYENDEGIMEVSS